MLRLRLLLHLLPLVCREWPATWSGPPHSQAAGLAGPLLQAAGSSGEQGPDEMLRQHVHHGDHLVLQGSEDASGASGLPPVGVVGCEIPGPPSWASLGRADCACGVCRPFDVATWTLVRLFDVGGRARSGAVEDRRNGRGRSYHACVIVVWFGHGPAACGGAVGVGGLWAWWDGGDGGECPMGHGQRVVLL